MLGRRGFVACSSAFCVLLPPANGGRLILLLSLLLYLLPFTPHLSQRLYLADSAAGERVCVERRGAAVGFRVSCRRDGEGNVGGRGGLEFSGGDGGGVLEVRECEVDGCEEG